MFPKHTNNTRIITFPPCFHVKEAVQKVLPFWAALVFLLNLLSVAPTAVALKRHRPCHKDKTLKGF